MKKALVCAVAALMLAPPVMATETVTYSYDSQGRLMTVKRQGSTNNVQTDYRYDEAGNRKTVTVTGAGNTSGARAIVVPLNGFTVIPIGG